MALLAIKGHLTRGEEVIRILEMLGGINKTEYNGDQEFAYYFINNNYIDWCHEFIPGIDFICFTLEEFLEKFPYKVGDKVIYKSEVFPIIGMEWNCCHNIVIYTMKNNCSIIDCYDSTWMKSYKEETMEDIIKIDIPKGYEFAGVDDDNQQVVFEKIGCQYPTTYDECCDMLNADEFVGYELMTNFPKLINARNAYWKIAGEQMGLGKPWKPDWNHDTVKYVIFPYQYLYSIDEENYRNTILAFPTKEMRDVFYENFKYLIEQCKELL